MAVKKNSKTKELQIQNNFISKFKEALPTSVGLAEELADVLGVSIDSAYRRIRGETELTIEEVYKLTKKYAISVDEVFSNRSDTVTFSYTKLIDSAQNLENYFNRISTHLETHHPNPIIKNYIMWQKKRLFSIPSSLKRMPSSNFSTGNEVY